MIPSRFSVFLFSTSFSDLPFILFVCFFSASYSIHNLHLVGIIIFTSLQGVMYAFMLAHFYQKKKSNGETVGRREQQAIYIQVKNYITEPRLFFPTDVTPIY